MSQPERVCTLVVEDGLGSYQIALGLGHLGAAEADHPLGEQSLERLPEALRGDTQVGQRLGEEPGVHQVEDGVFDAADVLVDGQPVVDRLSREWGLVVGRVGEAQEVPGGIHERVHGVGLPAGRTVAGRTGGSKEAFVGG